MSILYLNPWRFGALGATTPIDSRWLYYYTRCERMYDGRSVDSSEAGYLATKSPSSWLHSSAIGENTIVPGLNGNAMRTSATMNPNSSINLIGDSSLFPATGESLPKTMLTNSPTPLTIEMIFKINSAPDARYHLLTHRQAIYYNNYHPKFSLMFDKPTGGTLHTHARFLLRIDNTTSKEYTVNHNTGLEDGQWHHIALVKHRALHMQLFIDGKSVMDEPAMMDNSPSSNTGGSDALYVGCCHANGGAGDYARLSIDIDCFRIVDQALYTADFPNPVGVGELSPTHV